MSEALEMFDNEDEDGGDDAQPQPSKVCVMHSLESRAALVTVIHSFFYIYLASVPTTPLFFHPQPHWYLLVDLLLSCG